MATQWRQTDKLFWMMNFIIQTQKPKNEKRYCSFLIFAKTL